MGSTRGMAADERTSWEEPFAEEESDAEESEAGPLDGSAAGVAKGAAEDSRRSAPV